MMFKAVDLGSHIYHDLFGGAFKPFRFQFLVASFLDVGDDCPPDEDDAIELISGRVGFPEFSAWGQSTIVTDFSDLLLAFENAVEFERSDIFLRKSNGRIEFERRGEEIHSAVNIGQFRQEYTSSVHNLSISFNEWREKIIKVSDENFPMVTSILNRLPLMVEGRTVR